MKLERPNYFSDEDLQMELLYGPEGEFHKTSLNFWTDIYPNVLESYVSNHQPDKGYKDIFVDTSYYPLGIDQILRLAVRTFMDVFPACFEIDFTHVRENKIRNKEIKEFQSKKGLLGEVAKIYSKVNINGKFFFACLLDIISKFDGRQIKLTQNLPVPLYKDFVKEMKTPFYMLSDIANAPKIREEIDKLIFVPHPQAIKKIKNPKGYRLEKAEHARCVLILENINFDKSAQQLFWDIVSFPGGFTTLETAFFINCKFSANYVSDRDLMRTRVLFRNCFFEKELAPSARFRQSWKIINSTISDRLDLRKSEFGHGFFIMGCRFNNGSFLFLDGIIFEQNSYTHKLFIHDTIFGGVFSMTSAHCVNAEVSIKNVSFLQPFYMDGTLLSQKSSFEDIGFSLGSNPRMIASQKVFSQLLLQAGFATEVEILGLSTPSETNTKHKIDYYTAYRTGWLNPENAAIFLSKSKSWLAKKRIADRKKTTKTSIPFVGHLKGILYPRKALEAYRIQDWNTLQQQCKKYGIGIQGKPVLNTLEDDVIKWLNRGKTDLKRQSSENI